MTGWSEELLGPIPSAAGSVRCCLQGRQAQAVPAATWPLALERHSGTAAQQCAPGAAPTCSLKAVLLVQTLGASTLASIVVREVWPDWEGSKEDSVMWNISSSATSEMVSLPAWAMNSCGGGRRRQAAVG